MLWKVVGAALLMIGVALFAQLDQWPDMRGPRVMASAFLFFGLLVYAKGTEESIVTALREIDKPPSKSA
jgi:xanthine/uracil permease